nr:MAG TPA: hypothetical protein [Caudoviricetes sp.]
MKAALAGGSIEYSTYKTISIFRFKGSIFRFKGLFLIKN